MAKRMGKKKLLLKLVQVSTVSQRQLRVPCLIWNVSFIWGQKMYAAKELNVFRMELLGTKVVAVEKGSATLKDAVNEALRHWVTHIEDTHYILGSALGPHPFPTIVRDFQRVIGDETRAQILQQEGRLPDTVIACIGGGSNAIGMFYPFVEDQDVALYGVEAAG